MPDDHGSPTGGDDAERRDEPGEGGPLLRERSLLAGRFAVLQRQGQSQPGALSLAGPAAPVAPGQPPFAADFRTKLLDRYRQRQRLLLRRAGPPGATGLAPAPPPAVNWIPIGPCVVRQGQASNRPAVGGRVVGLAVAGMAGALRLYAATANGGVWRSDDGGLNWDSTMDAWDLDPTSRSSDSLACGAIAVDPLNPNRVYVGTGEGDAGAYFGVGPIRSDNAGASWVTEPSAPGSPTLAGEAFYQMVVDPGSPDRSVGATRAGLFRREPDGAGGFHWALKQQGTFSSAVAARTTTATTFFAAAWADRVYRSADGDSWTAAGAGFPADDVGRIGLAVRPDDPGVVYALIAKNSDNTLLGVWRLDAADDTWRMLSNAPVGLFGTTGGQGWYDLAIAVDPNNANCIYLGGSTAAVGGQWSGSLYRCLISSSGSGAGLSYTMTSTHIGGTVHADIHAIVFAPGDSNKLWVGCDGGIFYTETAAGDARFETRNVGLACLTMNHLAIHPTEDAILFCGTQDNGTTRYTGEEVWLHSDAGDGGFVVINWHDPYKVLRTYVGGTLFRTSDGGQSYASWHDASLPDDQRGRALFYAPLAGTPPNPAKPEQADIVAFGGQRLWLSTDFGGHWQSLPANSNSDDLPSQILSLEFASATLLYAGTIGGDVYRFEKNGDPWGRSSIGATLPMSGPVTCIAADPADATGNSIYITLGGTSSYRHVWFYNGASWEQRSGPSATSSKSLLDVQHNAIVVDPQHPGALYAGADIGVWRSTDGGATWSVFSDGLPDAAVLDLKLHHKRRLLWASTHGRGIYERDLDATSALAVELYIRATQLDRGRYPAVDGLDNPLRPGEPVYHWNAPDIKIDTPSAGVTYQLPGGPIDCYRFVDALTDGSGSIASTPAAPGAVTRVYIQVHNRGVVPANNVQVMLLVGNAAAALPPLPANYAATVRAGIAISTPDWQTAGIQTLNDVRVGLPRVAVFELPPSLLPPPSSLTGPAHQCLFVMLHCPAQDIFNNGQVQVDTLSLRERKAASKNMHLVQFTAAAGAPEPEWLALRLHGLPDKLRQCDLALDLNGYPGRVRMVVPPDIGVVAPLDQSLSGFVLEQSPDFRTWAVQKQQQLGRYQDDHTYNSLWCSQMSAAIAKAQDQPLLVAQPSQGPAVIRRFTVPPGAFHTVFIAVDRPAGAHVGDRYSFTIIQHDADTQEILGGSTYRVEVVPEPDVEEAAHLDIGGLHFLGFEVVYARLTDSAGKTITPADGADVALYLHTSAGIDRVSRPLSYHGGWRLYWLRVDGLPHMSAGVVKATVVARIKGNEARKTDVVRF